MEIEKIKNKKASYSILWPNSRGTIALSENIGHSLLFLTQPLTDSIPALTLYCQPQYVLCLCSKNRHLKAGQDTIYLGLPGT